MSKEAKVIRGQLRQIVKEMFVELVSTELYTALQKENASRLEQIANNVNETLASISARQKDVQSMIMRELFTQKAQPITSNEEKKTEEKS